MEEFKGPELCLVGGSTWPEDEEVLLSFINSDTSGVKFIIAPHKIDAGKIESFRSKLNKASVLYSKKEAVDLSNFQVLIVDTIGILTKIYSYADIAYVGGAMGSTGLHNILEPATFGVPIVIGDQFSNFPEAIRLRQLAGLFSISNAAECKAILEKLVSEPQFRSATGMINGHFVNSNTGATRIIMEYIDRLHRDRLV